MSETWINEKLCSIDELVRIERGPQRIELECNDDNLCDEVTHHQYRVGKRDAKGRLICPAEADEKVQRQARIDKARGIGSIEKGDVMTCVDWKGKHRPWLWKIYQKQPQTRLNMKTGDEFTVEVFVQVDEKAGVEDALKRAHEIRKEMS